MRTQQSIRGGPIDALNEEVFDRAACGFELQSELLLQRGEDVRQTPDVSVVSILALVLSVLLLSLGLLLGTPATG